METWCLERGIDFLALSRLLAPPMPYILSDQRDESPIEAFARYAAYIESERHRFPAGALALLDSDWYFGFSDPRAPHDAWLESVQVIETRADGSDSLPETSLDVRLLGAFHNGIIQFAYAGVTSYHLNMHDLSRGHRDWRYDEFRLSESGDLIRTTKYIEATETQRPGT